VIVDRRDRAALTGALGNGSLKNATKLEREGLADRERISLEREASADRERTR
jgi:hypothetical protein